MVSDPFADGRLPADGIERRTLLNSWLDAHRLVIETPSTFGTLPGGDWDEACLANPITRVPTGDQPGFPSCLDYAQAPHAFKWGAPADHALVSYTCTLGHVRSKRPKRSWICSDADSCINFCEALHAYC